MRVSWMTHCQRRERERERGSTRTHTRISSPSLPTIRNRDDADGSRIPARLSWIEWVHSWNLTEPPFGMRQLSHSKYAQPFDVVRLANENFTTASFFFFFPFPLSSYSSVVQIARKPRNRMNNARLLLIIAYTNFADCDYSYRKFWFIFIRVCFSRVRLLENVSLRERSILKNLKMMKLTWKK